MEPLLSGMNLPLRKWIEAVERCVGCQANFEVFSFSIECTGTLDITGCCYVARVLVSSK
jgi:hypothetical protein